MDPERLWGLLEEVNRFGALQDGGVERLAWTEPEVAARAWLSERCEGLGLDVEQDEAGNVWAWGGERPAVVMGSHLDTVPGGGRFDGALGICAGLETLRSARHTGIHQARRLALVCFTDEEGVRFGLGMTGSRAVAGNLDVEDVRDAVAPDGTRLTDAMRAAGGAPDRLPETRSRRKSMRAYLELHVEQGRRLERQRLPVGVVSAIVGLGHWHIDVQGEANHAGTTLSDDRHDALIPVAAGTLEAQRVMRSTEDLVATVGEAAVIGGAPNIVPGRARCTLDVRSIDETGIGSAAQRIVEVVRNSAAANGCKVDVRRVKSLAPAPMSGEVIEQMRVAAGSLGIEAPELPSMAGHDAMNLAAAGVPCGMVFVRSKRGLSHSPDEYSSPEDCAAGADLLATTALNLARREP